jgi:hypothetical protein
VFTIVGVVLSLDGGVCGGLEVSTFAPCERRRKRSEDAVAFGVSVSLEGSKSAFDAFEDDLGRTDSTKDFLSGLGLPVPDELFFLKTSRNRPTGEGERCAPEAGAARPVLLVASLAEDPRLSVLVLPTAKVEDRRGERPEEGLSDVCEGCVSRWTAACTIGEFVVR